MVEIAANTPRPTTAIDLVAGLAPARATDLPGETAKAPAPAGAASFDALLTLASVPVVPAVSAPGAAAIGTPSADPAALLAAALPDPRGNAASGKDLPTTAARHPLAARPAARSGAMPTSMLTVPTSLIMAPGEATPADDATPAPGSPSEPMPFAPVALPIAGEAAAHLARIILAPPTASPDKAPPPSAPKTAPAPRIVIAQAAVPAAAAPPPGVATAATPLPDNVAALAPTTPARAPRTPQVVLTRDDAPMPAPPSVVTAVPLADSASPVQADPRAAPAMPSANTAPALAAQAARPPHPTGDPIADTLRAPPSKEAQNNEAPGKARVAPAVATVVPSLPAPPDQGRVATAPAATAPQARIDVEMLVDTIARARADAPAGSAPVAVALTHGEFGKVSLRLRAEDDGLSVTMASADPAFAPAVAAASQAAGAQQTASGTPQDSPRGDPAPRHQPLPEGPTNNASTGGTGSGAGSSEGRQNGGARSDSARHDQAPPERRSPRNGGQTQTARDGIFA